MRSFFRVAAVLPAALVVLLAGCSSTPDVVQQPTVEVSQLSSTVITPQLVKFVAKVVIHNVGKPSLDFDRVDYAVDLYDAELFHDSFGELLRTKGRGTQTVTLPFQIAMDDILKQAPALLAEGSLRVRFRGTVYPDSAQGLSPAPFATTATIPIPKMPALGFGGAQGNPLAGEFAVRVLVMNRNDFPITVSRVDSYVEIQKMRYQLLHNETQTPIQPGETRSVELVMQNTTGKKLSMILNTITATSPDDFQLGGTVEFGSPYGWIVIPLEVGR